jgi:hypothetical protein
MRKDLIRLPALNSSFLSCEKDIELILRRLFVESRPYSDELKRLLVISAKDCLDNTTNTQYQEKLKEMTVAKMVEDGYIRLEPKLRFPEHEQVKSYIIVSFDNFTMNTTNPQFRDCTVSFDIICHTDYWDIGNYRLRPLKICGYIDGLLNNTKLTGIGQFNFLGCNELILNEDLAGYTLMYQAVHGTDDQIPGRDE